MAVLRIALAALALTACYSPELRDCAVSCASADDCAPGQLCGADRWCAAPEIAGRCESGGGIDASASADAGVDAPADAAPSATLLVVQIGGHGIVTSPGTGTCSDMSPGHQCTYAVIAGVPKTLVAEGTGEDEFEQWTGACTGQGATCALTPASGTTTTQAKFKH